ncbi:MAG TPA: GGDEF domain-containing protein [Candidatus Dormibacteraeota bacterium]
MLELIADLSVGLGGPDNPFEREGLLRRVAPFMVAAMLGLLCALGSGVSLRQPWLLLLAVCLIGVILAVALCTPWNRLPRLAQAAPPMAYFWVVLLVYQSTGGTVKIYEPLVLLPLFWMAIHHTRPELWAGIVCAATVLVVPTALHGTWAELAELVFWAVVAGIAGLTVQRLVEQIRERARALSVAAGEQLRLERIRTLQFTVTRTLAEAASPAEAAPLILAGIGATVGSIGGALLLVDPDEGVLRREAAWREPSSEWAGVGDTVGYGEGVAGRAWASGRIETGGWLAAFPLLNEGQINGVMLLGCTAEPALDADVAVVLADIGSQIGQFIERRTIEAALRDTAQRLATLAGTDPLTGLANRREFERVLALPPAGRFAILAIDVDGLKAINDSYGHDAGDAALRAVGMALRLGLRDRDTVARTGGDEFAALLVGADVEEAATVAERLRTSMYGIALARGQARLSIGCANGAGDADPGTVWILADEALYRAKVGGRDRSVVSTAAQSGHTGSRARWESYLPELIASQGMRAVYQPIIELEHRRAVGYEGLSRPVDGPLDAGVEGLFAAAHQLGLGRDLDWVCRRAILRNCHELPAGHPVFINVGATPLLDPVHDVDQMLLLLRSAGRVPQEVVLEITEREAVRDLDRLREVVAIYRAEGFRFALDDVGEGFSTFDALATVIPEFIKVAGKLTRQSHARGPRAAVEALVTFARSTGAEVIAEGLESEEQVATVLRLGVTLGQGFVLARPAEPARWRELHPDAVVAVPRG